MKLGALCVVASGLLAGCSIFVPFESEFSCTADRNYGKCTDVDGAYSEALGGTLDVEYVGANDVAKRRKKDRSEGKKSGETAASPDGLSRYKQAEYEELAKLIEAPVTPVVKPPEVLRTLVVAYATGEKTLYMPRYIFYFASDAGFVLGDYLSNEQAPTPMLYPNSPGSQ